MFLFHDLKIIYIVVPGTASSSFQLAMMDKYKNFNLFDKVHKEHEAWPLYPGNKMSKHFTARQAKMVIEPDIWNEYKKIAFVRHPYNWSRSIYRKKRVEIIGFDNSGTFKEHVERLPMTPYDWFVDENGQMLIDTIYRTEDMEDVTEKFGIENRRCQVSKTDREANLTPDIEAILKSKFWREYNHYPERVESDGKTVA